MKKNQHLSQDFIRLLEERKNQNIDDQISEAGRIVTVIDSVDSKIAYAQIAKRIQNRKSTSLFILTLSRIAAILFIPLLIATIWLYNQPKTPRHLFAFRDAGDKQPSGYPIQNCIA